MKIIRVWASIIVFLAAFAFASCSKTENGGGGEIDVQFRVPENVELEYNATTLDFRVQFQKSPKETDKIVLKDPVGVEHTCDIVSVSTTKFTVSLYSGMVSGKYSVSIKRGNAVKLMGEMVVSIYGDGVEPADGSTVYGKISCNGVGVPDVVVSDGYEVVKTDADGVYQMRSAKYLKYVFMSVPSGYEPEVNGILPKIHSALTSPATKAERVDFVLNKVEGQDKYKVFFLGDMHLANRTDDRTQFTEFTDDWNRYRDKHKSEKMYAITLGDMTWDLYWYSNQMELKDYLDLINARVSDIIIYHTMGNHDNDMLAKSGYDAKLPYDKTIAPQYYSFNIGKVHYVVIDDIDCTDYDGTSKRKYQKNLTQNQLDWLKKDLAYVSTSTPIVLTTHAQLFYPSEKSVSLFKYSFSNVSELLEVLDGYKVHAVTGHTHTIFNALPEDTALLGAKNLQEHNAGAVCASWWWSAYLTPGVHISLDGAPGGYSIWDVDGTDFKWKYKATGKSEDYQFRSYDLNNFSVSYGDVPKLKDAEMKLAFAKYVLAYPKNTDNEVLINVWNWNPKWTLTVTDEHGKDLKWTRTFAYDPLHIKALTIPRFNKNITKEPSFITESKMPHFFKVKANNATDDLTITVKDEFGNVYTENMARPKAFNTLTDYTKY